MLDHVILSDNYLSINHLIHIYELYICNSRNREIVNIEHSRAVIDKTKRIEEEISMNMSLKKDRSILRNGVLSLRILF